MNLGLQGRVAIVTGSTRGIGRAIAESLAAEGAAVAVNGRAADAVEETARALAARGARTVGVVADVSDPDACRRLVDETVRTLGQVDLLVNNVGGGQAESIQAPLAEWQEALDLTVWPALRLAQLVAPAMRERRQGVIVMIASLFGRELGGRPGYQVAKSAEISLAKALAHELAPDNVRVVAVAPGSILFPGGSWWRRQQADPDGIERFVAQELPLGRFGRPEEVADVVAFLCSDRASLLTGTCVAVDGCQGRSLI